MLGFASNVDMYRTLRDAGSLAQRCRCGVRQWTRFLSTRSDATIYALSTAPQKAAIAIVRVSGPSAASVYRKLTRSGTEPVPGRATTRRLFSKTGDLLDSALVLFFKGPRSYTGEDVVELHVHGGRAVTKAIMGALRDLDSNEMPMRYAEPGEFTKRSFYNGRLDLTEIEGIRDVIDAETEFQRQAAVTAAEGRNRALYDKWREEILAQTALLTALIDFADDNAEIETSASELVDSVTAKLAAQRNEVERHLVAAQRGELLREGIRVSFLGPPNAGKSSLLNALVQRDAAIVSDVPGTTRDVLEVGIDLRGFKIVFGDTAGLRSLEDLEAPGAHPADRIEAEGIRRALQSVSASDVVVVVVSAEQETLSPLVASEVRKLQQNGKAVVVAINKSDLVDTTKNLVESVASTLGVPSTSVVTTSSLTVSGVENLVDAVSSACKALTTPDRGEPHVAVSHRVQELLASQVVPSLDLAKTALQANDVVVASAELDAAVEAIGQITGRGIGVEEILGSVFSSFCVGK